jgi:hypothetical protein
VIQIRTTVLLLIYLLLTNSLQAQENVGNRFLEINPETVSAACGDADGTRWENPFSVWLNPAGAAEGDAAFLSKNWIEGERIVGFGYSTPLPGVDLTALAYASSIGDLWSRSGPEPEPDGSFTAHDLVLSLTLAREVLPHLRFGITGKYINEKIYDETADGLAVDLGIQYDLPWVAMSGSVSNLGRVNSLETERSALPRTIRLNAGTTLDFDTIDLRVMTSFASVTESDPTFSVGSELTFKRSVSLRSGYLFNHDTRSFSLGAGFRLRQWRCDYAYIPFEKFGDTQQFTITYSF